MDWWWWLIIGLVVAPAVGGLIHTSERRNAFAQLGDIKGLPVSEIIKRVGEPNSISVLPDGNLYQWIQTVGGSATHYAIVVDLDGNTIGYAHQHSG